MPIPVPLYRYRLWPPFEVPPGLPESVRRYVQMVISIALGHPYQEVVLIQTEGDDLRRWGLRLERKSELSPDGYVRPGGLLTRREVDALREVAARGRDFYEAGDGAKLEEAEAWEGAYRKLYEALDTIDAMLAREGKQ